MAPTKELTDKEHGLIVNAWKSLKVFPEVGSVTAALSICHLSQIVDIASSIYRWTGTSSPGSAGIRTQLVAEMP